MISTRVRFCPSCHQQFESTPIFVADVAYCCTSCAGRHLCTCFAEADLAADGVDGLGHPFRLEEAARPTGSLVA